MLGFIRQVYDAKRGISSSDRAMMTRDRELSIQMKEQAIAENNAKLTMGARDEYDKTQLSLQKKQSEVYKQLALVGDDEEQRGMIIDSYNDDIKILNARMNSKKKGIAKQYLASGQYTFKETDSDNYDLYTKAQKEAGQEPVSKAKWITNKSLDGMKQKGLFNYEDFNTMSLTSTEKDGKKVFGVSFLDKDGNVADTDSLGTIDDSLKIYGGEANAEQKGKLQQIQKNAQTKQNLQFLKTNKKELGLSSSQISQVMKKSMGLTESNFDKFDRYVKKLNIPQDKKEKLREQFAKKTAGFVTGKSSEFERLKENVVGYEKKGEENLTPEEKADYKWIKKRMDRLTQSDLSSMLINKNFVTDYEEDIKKDFAGKYEWAKEGFNISTVDMSKLKPEDQTKIQQWADYRLQATKTKGAETLIKNAVKTTETLNVLSEGIDQTLTALGNGQNINFIDKAIRDNLGKYLGMSDTQLETALRDSNTASAMNTVRNALFGSTVSAGEENNFKQMAGSLWQTNKSVLNGMTGLLNMTKSKLEAQRDALGNDVFNVKFGTRLKQINSLLGTISEAKKGKIKATAKTVISTSTYKKANTEQPKKKQSWKQWDK